MSDVNRRIRELTEARAALERRLGELSADNDRLRAAHAEVFAAHKDERARRQDLEAVINGASAIIADALAATSRLPEDSLLKESARRRAETWYEAEVHVGPPGKPIRLVVHSGDRAGRVVYDGPLDDFDAEACEERASEDDEGEDA